MIDYWYIFAILAIAAFVWRKDLRREMVWAGVLALPLLLFQVLVSRSFSIFTTDAAWLIIRSGLMIFSLGAIASALYEILLGKTLTPQKHPHRRRLFWLAGGLIVFGTLFFGASQSLITSLLLGLLTDLVIVLVVRRDLLWDAIVSGAGLALLYGTVFFATLSITTGSVTSLIFSQGTLGITLFSLPLEEIVAVFLFGALWGPLYAAAKYYEEPDLPQFTDWALHPKLTASLFICVGVLGAVTWFAGETLLPPTIKAVSPDPRLGVIGAASPIRLTFNRPVDRNRMQIDIAPDLNGQWTFTEPTLGSHAFRAAVFTPDPAWQPGTNYTLTIDHVSSLLGRGDKKFTYYVNTEALPAITKTSIPEDQAVNICDPITITLANQNNNLAEFSWRLQPDTDLIATLSNDATQYTLTPVGCLRPATEYTLTAERQATVYDAENQNVISVSEPVTVLVKTFSTAGSPPAPAPAPSPLTIREVSPRNGGTGISTTTSIRVNFSQPVDHQAAEKALTVQPLLNARVSWDGQVMIIKPVTLLAADTEYWASVTAGLTSVSGQTLTAEYAWSFRTATPTTRLNIALDYQDKPLSCEAAALKMALAGKGIKVSENDIMTIVGYDSTPRQGDTWGDPDSAFVGNISGKQNTTGYGVHWLPIERAAKRWREKSEAFSGWTIQQLAEAIAAGNPIIIWGTVGSAYYDPWKTPSDKLVKAWKGEHTRTVIGFIGTVANPKSFILNDPYVGRITWSAATLKGNWARFDNSGVVVR